MSEATMTRPAQVSDRDRADTARSPYLFVVGCQRSGTTLLQRMLDCHPLLAVENDVNFIPLVINELPVDADPPITPELVERVIASRWFDRLGQEESAVNAVAARSERYSEFVSGLYGRFAAGRGKPFAGQKCPSFVRYLPRLHHLFPWARVVHLIRDGRDVALSCLEWAREGRGPSRFALWHEEPVGACALWWRWQVGIGRREGALLGAERYLELRYEDLIGEPQTALRRVTDFLALPDAPEMLAYHVGKTRLKPGRSAKKAWLPPTLGLRDWQAHMSRADQELFEALAGDRLAELGYERVYATAGQEIAAKAERCRDRWAKEVGYEH